MLKALARRAKAVAWMARHRAFLLLEDPLARIRLLSPLRRPYWRWRFHSFGRDSVVHRPYWLHGAHKMAIGDEVMIFPAWLSVAKDAWESPEPALQIGDRSHIAMGCLIGAAESVVIEEDVSIGAYTLIVDCEHTINGPHVSLARNPLETAPVRIGRGSSIAGRTAVLWGTKIGKHCFVGSNSVVHGDVPDHAIVAGAPARVIGWTRDPEGAPLGGRGIRETTD